MVLVMNGDLSPSEVMRALKKHPSESKEEFAARTAERTIEVTMAVLTRLMLESKSEKIKMDAAKTIQAMGGLRPDEVEVETEPPRTQFRSFLAKRASDFEDGGEGCSCE